MEKLELAINEAKRIRDAYEAGHNAAIPDGALKDLADRLRPNLGGICENGRKCIAILAGLPVNALLGDSPDGVRTIFPHGLMLVAVAEGRTEGDNLPRGETFLVSNMDKNDNTFRALCTDGRKTDWTRARRDHFRVATDDEIRAFLIARTSVDRPGGTFDLVRFCS